MVFIPGPTLVSWLDPLTFTTLGTRWSGCASSTAGPATACPFTVIVRMYAHLALWPIWLMETSPEYLDGVC